MFKFINKAKNQKGFTLVELMVVVVIIGVLVAIAVPVYNGIQTRAEEAAIEANERTLDGAWMIYQADQGTWPDDYIQVDSGDENSVTIDGKTYTRTDNSWSLE